MANFVRRSGAHPSHSPREMRDSRLGRAVPLPVSIPKKHPCDARHPVSL